MYSINKKFYVDDCPDTCVVGDWIKSQLPWREARNDIISSSENSNILNFVYKFKGDLDGLKKSVDAAIDKYGFFGWKTSEGDEDAYGGYSITYNPNLQYEDQDIHQHTLGTKLNTPNDFYAGSSNNHKLVKNSYLDGMAFTELTPAAKIGYMGEFLEELSQNITITRSRLGIVKGSRISTNFRYHVDAEVFELMRLNIPVRANKYFGFQFESQQAYILEEGRAYTWQTYAPHRVFCYKENDIDRSNMVIGLSPWLTYNKEERYWYTNKFFGKKHPFDMMLDGDITDKVEFIEKF